MSKKRPAFLLYSADFLVGTDYMTDAQVGRYIRLLCKQHQQGHIPEREMLRVCHGRDAVVFSKFTMDAEGSYYNKKLNDVIEADAKKCEKLQNNIKKRWSEKNGEYKCNTNDVTSACITNEVTSRVENENSLLSFDSSFDFQGGTGGDPPKEPAKKESKLKPSDFEPPGHLADMWPDYLAVRRAKKAAPTVRAFEGIVKELERLAPADNDGQRAILEQSIRSGWVDVYELKNKGGGYGRGNGNGGDDVYSRRYGGLV